MPELDDGFALYGFRVPAVVVSAYAKPNRVSHVLYDHTSILVAPGDTPAALSCSTSGPGTVPPPGSISC